MNHNLIKRKYAKKNLKMSIINSIIKLDIADVIQANTGVLHNSL